MTTAKEVKMIEMILENSKKLVEAGMEVNEVIKATTSFLIDAGLDSNSITVIEITLKFQLDADFKESYTEWLAEEIA
jgi:CO dehydrogenase/acetyl-CoA synthase epsilon subunit